MFWQGVRSCDVETQRANEVNSKAISAVDGMLRFLNNNM